MPGLPLGAEAVEVAGHLLAALAHDGVVGLQLRDLPTHRVEGQPVRVEHGGELRVRGDDRRAERSDRTLLPEQGRGVQTPPAACRPDTGADLEMNVPVRVARARGVMHNADGLKLLNWHDLLASPRADPGDGVLAEPAPDLGHRVSLRRVQRRRHIRVQGGGN